MAAWARSSPASVTSVPTDSNSQARRSRSCERASRATIGRVAGVLLDQGEGLEHRVVQVGGHVGALLGAHPLGPLGAEVVHQAQRPGPDHDAPGRGHRAAPAMTTGPTDSSEPDHTAKRISAVTTSERPAKTRQYAAQPPPPKIARNGSIRPVESSHRSRCASSACRQSSPTPAIAITTGQKSAPWPKAACEAEHGAEEQRPDRDHRAGVAQPRAPARSLAGAGGALQAGRGRLEVRVARQEHPQAGVQHEADAVEDGEQHEGHAHPEDGHAEVPGQPAGHTAGDR